MWKIVGNGNNLSSLSAASSTSPKYFPSGLFFWNSNIWFISHVFINCWIAKLWTIRECSLSLEISSQNFMLYQMFGTLFPICKFSLPKQKYLEFFSYYYSCNNRFQQIIQKAAAIWGSGCFKNAIFSHDFMCLLDKKYHLRAARNKYWPISFLQQMY